MNFFVGECSGNIGLRNNACASAVLYVFGKPDFHIWSRLREFGAHIPDPDLESFKTRLRYILKIKPFDKAAARSRKIWNMHPFFKSWRKSSGTKRKRDDEGPDRCWTLTHAVNYELYELLHRKQGSSLAKIPGQLAQVVFGDLSAEPVAPLPDWWERLHAAVS